jgi:myo-inositol-1(or 4)-monophosphatase
MEAGFSICKKGQIDLVTDADHAVERFLISELKQAFPAASFCAEEQGWLEDNESDAVWFIDPLDGTTNFAHGFPYFSISVALAKNGQTVAGVVYNPVSKELFAAERGKGARRNGHPIKVSQNADLQDSLLVTGFPYNIKTSAENNFDQFSRATKASQGVRRTGSAALDLCNVACGRFDGYWEQLVNVWDIAAGALIVEEAGGTVTDYHGSALLHSSKSVIATNGLIHGQLLDVLQG